MAKHRSRVPPVVINREIERGALYSTPGGIRYFGQWLLDDCVTYPMACNEGIPINVAQQVSAHLVQYEHLLDMAPCRVSRAFFRELIIFDDYGQNRHKRCRFSSLREKLSKHIDVTPHTGVFVLRGNSGTRRVLRNEIELAERLKTTRGFRIVDPMTCSVKDILSACFGAQMAVGVEGSHLVHAVMTLKQGSSLLSLMPPFRFSTVLKDVERFEKLTGFPIL
ncbi:glycosyltransferase family 61 protein [Thermodesulfobacteriota bacterium]